MSPPPRSLDGLTGLRFLLAAWVVGFHYATPLASPWLERLRAGGPMLVYCFFTLSGFVMAFVYLGPDATRVRARQFWALRLARIYPLYLLAFLAMVPIALRFNPVWSPARTLDVVYNVLLVQNWLPDARFGLNHPAWSVSSEAFFYLVFPALAAWLARPLGRAQLVVGLVLAAGSYGALALGDDSPTAWSTLVSDAPLGQAAFFVFGILLGKLFWLDLVEARRRAGGAWALGGALALAGAMVLATGSHRQIVVARAATMAASGAILFGIAHGRGAWARLLASRPLVFLGDASYGIYILQMPVALAYDLVVLREKPHLPTFTTPHLLVMCAILVAIASASLVTVETPIRRAVRRWLARSDAAPAPS